MLGQPQRRLIHQEIGCFENYLHQNVLDEKMDKINQILDTVSAIDKMRSPALWSTRLADQYTPFACGAFHHHFAQNSSKITIEAPKMDFEVSFSFLLFAFRFIQ